MFGGGGGGGVRGASLPAKPQASEQAIWSLQARSCYIAMKASDATWNSRTPPGRRHSKGLKMPRQASKHVIFQSHSTHGTSPLLHPFGMILICCSTQQMDLLAAFCHIPRMKLLECKIHKLETIMLPDRFHAISGEGALDITIAK